MEIASYLYSLHIDGYYEIFLPNNKLNILARHIKTQVKASKIRYHHKFKNS